MGRRLGPGLVLLGVTGAVVFLAQIAGSPGAASTPRPLAPRWSVHGAVAADGAPEIDSGGWTVRRVGAGRYVLDLGRGRPAVAVRSWDAPTDATVIPYGRGLVAVLFDRDGVGIDTRFRFDAVVRSG